ncbi:hypothetical protein [Chryseobacterium ginsenosidimutans]|uniref:hypothetical protein n=1 Tax=Chryseobacterium ginsenosidimutans TaxID=687846 RepID=UPI0031E14AC2
MVLIVSSLVSAQIGINNENCKETTDPPTRGSSVNSEIITFPSLNDKGNETNDLLYEIIF